MPQIIVAADRGAVFGEGAVTFRERVTVADFESQHFATQLVERLGWAVEDADQAEQVPGRAANAAEPERTPGRAADAAEPERIPKPADEADRHEVAQREPVSAR